MLKVFIGFDHRQPISYNVLQFSILRRCSKPVCITPLVLPTLPIERAGLTPFTYSRFLVPYLCGFRGKALFMDLDMLVLDDLSKLEMEPGKAVMVVDTDPKFERASLMLFDCAHYHNRRLTPEHIGAANDLHGIGWTDRIGFLDKRWNHLVGYDSEPVNPAVIHYTMGIPAFPETEDSPFAEAWHEEHRLMNSTQPWVSLMGRSVHAAEQNGKLVPKYKVA